MSAVEATRRALVAFGTEGEVDWREAAVWLARVERFAGEAERDGAAAMTAARAGDWEEAVRRAEHAAALEFATGRQLWRRPSHTWQDLQLALEAAAREREAVAT